MSKPTNASRRLFLQQSAAVSAFGSMAPFALNLAAAGSASAATAGDYKALVCVFLQGGNDAYNTVLATDSASWANYSAVRNQAPDSIALLKGVTADATKPVGSPGWLGGVLPITPSANQGRTFALHPKLTDLQTMFNTQSRLAIVSNVGPLIEPLTKDEYNRKLKRVPAKLFSHNDQQNTWQAFAPEGATVGWGGRLADAIAADNGGSMFTAISSSGNSVWLNGQTVKQYQVATGGAIRLGTYADGQGVSRVYNSPQVGSLLESMVRRNATGPAMSKDIGTVNGRSIDGERVLTAALAAYSPDSAPFGPASALMYDSIVQGTQVVNPLAEQLRIVARTIAARTNLGVKRQVFFVSVYGFDTHDLQNKNHAELMARLNHGLKYFDNALQALGVSDAVTTFTASDFGRTFTSNGDGTDHGWGGHHFVMGGAVAGGNIYGAFPTLGAKNANNNDFDSSPDQLLNGVLLPKVSVDQYGASLGRWLGASESAVSGIFRNLPNFSGGLGLFRA